MLFLLRVIGQALIVFAEVRWLPPMPAWQSGLLPYPVLLASQCAILAVQAKVSIDFARGDGVTVRRRPRLGRSLVIASAVYFTGMVVRYALTMLLYPERRWLGTGTIPIVFHWVLAAYLSVLGRWHAKAEPDAA